MQLRLKQLVIERPRLAIRRDRAGVLHVAGLEFDPAQQTRRLAAHRLAAAAARIVVRDALITWNDDLRNAPQLVLDRVQFRLENEAFGRHRFGLTGTPPAELAAPIDIRVEVAGSSLREWQRTAGRAYVRLDYADVAAWREWLPLPVPHRPGQGRAAALVRRSPQAGSPDSPPTSSWPTCERDWPKACPTSSCRTWRGDWPGRTPTASANSRSGI